MRDALIQVSEHRLLQVSNSRVVSAAGDATRKTPNDCLREPHFAGIVPPAQNQQRPRWRDYQLEQGLRASSDIGVKAVGPIEHDPDTTHCRRVKIFKRRGSNIEAGHQGVLDSGRVGEP
jgi:hypothetical protein